MDLTNSFYIEILSALNRSGVKYVLVGGLAVSYHGYSRYTGDMDLWIKPDEQNMNKLYSTLVKIGYPEEVVDDIRINRDIKNPTPIKLKDDHNRLKIDLMTNTFQKKITWEECYNKSEMILLESVSVPVIHIDHLIQMKENTNRLDNSMKDLVDAQELKKINELKKNLSNKNKSK